MNRSHLRLANRARALFQSRDSAFGRDCPMCHALAVFFIQFVLACIGSVKAAEPMPLPPFLFSETQESNHWFKTFKKWDATDAGQTVDPEAILCVGSSSMAGWHSIKKDLAPCEIIHRGFGGSTMNGVLVYKDFLARYRAKRIIVYEGDNDLTGRTTVETFLENCRKFVEYIHGQQPQTEIYFLSVKPSIRRAGRWGKFQNGNKALIAYTEKDKRLHYIDIATPMLDEKGIMRPDIYLKDNLHMNATGYAIWTKVIRPFVVKKETK